MSHEITSPRPAAVELYDAVGTRAYTLARWITGDDALACAAVIAAFGSIDGHDASASVLRDVRRRALAAAPRRAHRSTRGTERHISATAQALRDLPEPQRELIELVVIGRSDLASVATATARRPVDAMRELVAAMRGIAPATAAPSSV